MFERFSKPIIITLLFMFCVSGCVTNKSTDPSQITAIDGITYQIGANDKLEGELERQEIRSQQLQDQLKDSQHQLNANIEKAENVEKKLTETKFKTQKAADKARKLSAEIRLKKQDLKSKQQELLDLEQSIKALKAEKSNKKNTIIRLNHAEQDLLQAKAEISVLTEYMNDNLFIEAENALLYD